MFPLLYRITRLIILNSTRYTFLSKNRCSYSLKYRTGFKVAMASCTMYMIFVQNKQTANQDGSPNE